MKVYAYQPTARLRSHSTRFSWCGVKETFRQWTLDLDTERETIQ